MTDYGNSGGGISDPRADPRQGVAYSNTVAAYGNGVEDERSIDELITIAEELPERYGLGERIGQVRGTARGDGISVSVDVHGMPVELDLADRALDLGPERLAAEISRLSAEAGTNALRDALRAIKYGSTPRLAAMLGDYLGIPDEPAPRPSEPLPATDDSRERHAAPDRHDDSRKWDDGPDRGDDSREPDDEDGDTDHGFLVRAMEPGQTPVAQPTAPAHPAEAPPRRAARRTPTDEDEDDDFGGGILIRGT
ncbi:MAG TPA: hypothetical protein VFG87_22545 [Amycolatopsis sp.]|nr:hypothetical protein [Amycolatopsis sp.]